ncbi:recombinase family protein [Microbacterium lacticum]|uniref:recombinase family protein n=1 Tax=Microbacterium lacticum TaxID=33885 RepID=UPI0018B04603|nr:recombinase family protein [Microbacterium lacticum]MBF9336925.1 recombinase family protein [Microbacterium lacticum]
MDAVTYTRTAVPNPAAHERQREACERLAAELGYEVIGEFHDVDRARPALDQLLATVRDRKTSAVLVAGLDRLGRTFDTFAHVMETLDDADVPLYVVGQGRVNLPTTPTLGIMRAIAEYEAEHAGDDITY